jgi:4-hydroxybenzoate polyprenyltransferase
VRWREWYASKIPFVWTACAAAALGSPLGDVEAVRRAAGVIVFTCLCGAFGHLANDFADRLCDQAAGRRTPAARMAAGPATLVLVLLAAAALGVLATVAASPQALAAGVATVALAAAYSLPPFRLKVRRSAGIWSAAAAQRTLPMLVAFTTIDRLDATAWMLLLVAQLAGTRWMLVHQVMDAESDRSAGVETWVSFVGEARARSGLRCVVFPLECALLGVALWLEAVRTPFLWLLPVMGVLASGAWAWQCRGVQAPYSLQGYSRQPLAGFYQVIWPLGFSVALAMARPAMWAAVAVFLAWEHRYIGHQLLACVRFLRHGARPLPGVTA